MNEKILSKIEGFLEAISEINSLLQYQIKYEYSFKKLEITGNIKNGFKDFIISKYIEFSDKNPDWNCNVEEFRLKMDNLFDLIEIAFLSKSFIEKLRQWFLIRYIDDLKKIYKINNRDRLIYTFTEFIKDFFDNKEFTLFQISKEIKNDLLYFWGGVGFDDFLFSCNGNIYLLHFEFCD